MVFGVFCRESARLCAGPRSETQSAPLRTSLNSLNREGSTWSTARALQSGASPVGNQHFANGAGWPKNLARDRHHDHVRPAAMIGGGTDDDGGTLLRGGLVGERKRYENDVAEIIGGRIRHRRRCPTRRGMRRLRDASRPA